MVSIVDYLYELSVSRIDKVTDAAQQNALDKKVIFSYYWSCYG